MGSSKAIQSSGPLFSERSNCSIEIAPYNINKASLASFIGNELKTRNRCFNGQTGDKYLQIRIKHTPLKNICSRTGKYIYDGIVQKREFIANTLNLKNNTSHIEGHFKIQDKPLSENTDVIILLKRRFTRGAAADSNKKYEKNSKTEESAKEELSPSRAKLDSWASRAGAREPLSKEEEAFFHTNVQDLIWLESKRDELERNLGRKVNTEEWAEHVGISIFRLYARIGRGRAAKRKMIAANLPLVDSVARKYHGRGLSHWELCQEGVWGLLKSADKYDISFKAKFSSYAFFWIHEKISSACRQFGHVLTVGRSIQRSAARIFRHKELFQEMNCREPTLEELASCSSMKKEKIREVFDSLGPSRSLEQMSTSAKSKRSSIELAHLKSRHFVWQNSRDAFKKEVEKAMCTLAPREKQVLELRYGLKGDLPQSRAQVALMMDLHYETTRITEKVALEKLRKFGFTFYFDADISS